MYEPPCPRCGAEWPNVAVRHRFSRVGARVVWRCLNSACGHLYYESPKHVESHGH